jgi:hypothetical protein
MYHFMLSIPGQLTPIFLQHNLLSPAPFPDPSGEKPNMAPTVIISVAENSMDILLIRKGRRAWFDEPMFFSFLAQFLIQAKISARWRLALNTTLK